MNGMETRYLNITEAIALYREKTGREITDNGLFYLAERNNFVTKADDGFHYNYNREKMIKYLDQILKPLPGGYLTIGELAKKYGMSYSGVYYLVNKYRLKPFDYGNRKMLAYDENAFKDLL